MSFTCMHQKSYIWLRHGSHRQYSFRQSHFRIDNATRCGAQVDVVYQTNKLDVQHPTLPDPANTDARTVVEQSIQTRLRTIRRLVNGDGVPRCGRAASCFRVGSESRESFANLLR